MAIEVAECDLLSLSAELRLRVVDALAEHARLPVVMVNDRVVAHSGQELDAIVEAVRDALAAS